MILITGAAGLCGSAVVDEFARRGERIRALVRDSAKIPAPGRLPTVEFVVGDMTDAAAMKALLAGVTTVLLITAASPDLAATQRSFVDAARHAGVGRIVKLSGAESGIGFDASAFRFTRMHEAVERHLESSGLAWTHLRPSQFMQVYLREARAIAASGVLRLPLADIELAPIDVRDIAGVARHVLLDANHAGQSYDMTGPEALTMSAIAATIADVTGRPCRYEAIAPAERRAALLAVGMPVSFADAMDEQTAERLKRPRSAVRLEAQRRCGVAPTSFRDFAVRHRAAFRNEP